MSFALSYAWVATQTSWLLASFIGLSAYLVVGMVLVLSAPPFALIAVMGIVLAAFSHRVSGNMFTIHLLRGMVSGFYSFTAFCLTVTLALHAMGVAATFALALCISLGVHLLVLWIMRRSRQRVPA